MVTHPPIIRVARARNGDNSQTRHNPSPGVEKGSEKDMSLTGDAVIKKARGQGSTATARACH